MIHPIVRLAAAQPMLLARHVGAYAALASQEMASNGAALQRRLGLQLLAALCLAVTAVLAGVALLLWAALPLDQAPAPWLLPVIPWLPALLGLWAWRQAQAEAPTEPFARLRVQLALDATLLGRTQQP